MRIEELPPGGLAVVTAATAGDKAGATRLLIEVLFEQITEARTDISGMNYDRAYERLSNALDLEGLDLS